MAVWINFVCDHEGCKQLQQVGFDQFSETWSDMIKTMKNAGWKLDMEDAKVIKAICPKHK